jgi:formylglycine-generating enzyme required for sulfatase activity
MHTRTIAVAVATLALVAVGAGGCGRISTPFPYPPDADALDTVDVAEDATPTADTTPDAEDVADDATEDAAPADIQDDDAQDAEDLPDTATGCQNDAQCPTQPSDACQKATCAAGTCVTQPAADGTPCGPGVQCLTWGGVPVLRAHACLAGVCGAESHDTSCQDGLWCTTDTCSPASGCQYTPSDTACDDSNACTTDTCVVGTGCTSAPSTGSCDDGDPCTAGEACANGSCSGGKASCSCQAESDCTTAQPCLPRHCTEGWCTASPAAGEDCDDGNACTTGDVCGANGACAGQPVACDDGLGCTIDACQPKQGCVFQADPLACEDGDPCTTHLCDVDNGCVTGVATDVKCDDGNACTTGDQCTVQGCAGGKQVVCEAGPECQAAACEPATGACVLLPAQDGAQCDDGNPCSPDDTCQAGVCVSGANPCDDGNGCTLDVCAPDGSCSPQFQDVACNADGSVCTENDHCFEGTCKAGSPKGCDDKNPCTIDSCASAKGCVAEPVTQGTPCGADKWCLAGQCKAVVSPPGMVYVSAATFTMGCNAKLDSQCKGDEVPAHPVALGSYLIDRTEVTVAQYQKCVEGGACSMPGVGKDATYGVAGKEALPVNYIQHMQAQAYCTWTGGRLCTEAEWEFAARGADGRLYPWGNTVPNCDLAQFGACPGGIQPATSNAKGASPIGALNMAGNVREWVADWYAAGYYAVLAKGGVAQGPLGPDKGTSRVTRGGYSLDTAPELRTSSRSFASPLAGAFSLGARCCRSPK